MFAIQLRCLRNKAADFLVVSRNVQQYTSISAASGNQFTNVSIDVPWGKVEGKLWGSTGKQPILAVHGWMDNAGTFDDIAPYLLKNSSILAIDLPGHGLSSWLPRGIPYNENVYTMTLRMIVKNFGWNKVKLLGHSLGGIICYNYTRLYPEETQFVVSIDSLAFIADTVTNHSRRNAKRIDHFIDYQKKITNIPPSYSEEVIIDKWMEGTVFNSLDVTTTKTLMIRGVKKNENGTYYFTRDTFLRASSNSCYTMENLREMTELITCPYLVVKAENTPHHNELKYWGYISEILKRKSKDFQTVSVKGNHHVHMTDPEIVASHVVPFLEKYDT